MIGLRSVLVRIGLLYCSCGISCQLGHPSCSGRDFKQAGLVGRAQICVVFGEWSGAEGLQKAGAKGYEVSDRRIKCSDFRQIICVGQIFAMANRRRRNSCYSEREGIDSLLESQTCGSSCRQLQMPWHHTKPGQCHLIVSERAHPLASILIFACLFHGSLALHFSVALLSQSFSGNQVFSIYRTMLLKSKYSSCETNYPCAGTAEPVGGAICFRDRFDKWLQKARIRKSDYYPAQRPDQYRDNKAPKMIPHVVSLFYRGHRFYRFIRCA